jgi:hypothetical protein
MKFRLKEQFLVALVICSLAGCSSEPSRYAATGTVSMDGKPAPFVVVTFHATSGDAKASGSGKTDDQGKFTVGETGKNSGFQSGEYKVTFSQTLVKGVPTLAGSGGKPEEKIATEKQAVADEYRSIEKTPVSAKIGSGSNDFKFEIKSSK